MRTEGVRRAGAVALAVVLAACSPARPRHLVLLTVDTLRADHVGA
jgi:hypothetical protein